MRRWLTLLLVVALAAGGWYGYQYWLKTRQAAQEVPAYETVTVTRGTIASTVSATGSIQPNAEVTLSFRTPGLVTQVAVTAGQTVAQGDVLASLDTTDLVLTLAQAKVTLEINEAQLAKAEKPASAEDIAAAEANVQVAQANIAGAQAALASAQAGYDKLVAGPTEEERTVNRAEVMQAEANVKRAQQAYDQVRHLPSIAATQQSADLERATQALEVAQAKAALTDMPPDAAQLAAARNQIAQAEVAVAQAQGGLITAQSQLATLQDGPAEEDLAVLRAQVRQAQINQLQAENALANAQIVAPFAGVVTAVNLDAGTFSNTALPDIVLTDLSSFYMELLVDEIDVRQIEVDQPVAIRLDALPDADVTGRVTKLARTATDVNGVKVYEGAITLDPTDAPLRAGMSATALVTTADLDNVLLVPNRFIQINRENGSAFVYKLVNGAPVRQTVELGVRNEGVTEIVDGLASDDTLALVTQSSQEELRGTLFGGN